MPGILMMIADDFGGGFDPSRAAMMRVLVDLAMLLPILGMAVLAVLGLIAGRKLPPERKHHLSSLLQVGRTAAILATGGMAAFTVADIRHELARGEQSAVLYGLAADEMEASATLADGGTSTGRRTGIPLQAASTDGNLLVIRPVFPATVATSDLTEKDVTALMEAAGPAVGLGAGDGSVRGVSGFWQVSAAAMGKAGRLPPLIPAAVFVAGPMVSQYLYRYQVSGVPESPSLLINMAPRCFASSAWAQDRQR